MITAFLLEGCGYSEAAGKILKTKKIKHQIIKVPQDEKIKNNYKKKHKMNTFPQLFFTDEKKKTYKIGGYDDLIYYLDYIENIKSNKLNKDFILFLIKNKKL